jgi:hypothetical protein
MIILWNFVSHNNKLLLTCYTIKHNYAQVQYVLRLIGVKLSNLVKNRRIVGEGY